MQLAYFKRLRMEIDLTGRDLTPAPSRFRFLSWDDSLLDAFARAKFLSFRREFDTNVFPCLGEYEGCRRLMAEIAGKPGFLPEATWLAISSNNPSGLLKKGTGSEHIHAKSEEERNVRGACPLFQQAAGGRVEYCGTVQGVRDQRGLGAIQNLGVVPAHRRGGLGMNLLLRTLAGFQQAGVRRVWLEVTAQNNRAIRLYQRAGFITTKVVYKTSEVEYAQ
jgi:ribosomal protein S18 acetylase RimI-like enzyme